MGKRAVAVQDHRLMMDFICLLPLHRQRSIAEEGAAEPSPGPLLAKSLRFQEPDALPLFKTSSLSSS